MHSSVQLLALSAQLCVGTIFIWTGLSKLANPAPIRHTMAVLGILSSVPAAFVLAIAEVGAGAALILASNPWLASVPVAILALTFLFAATSALHRHLVVDCACFGSQAGTPLGWRQIAVLPLWLAVAFSAVIVPPTFSALRPTFLLGALLIIALSALVILRPQYRENRAQRLAR